MQVESINEILFRHDPLGTCCKENDMPDEYWSVAEMFLELYPLRDVPSAANALLTAFNKVHFPDIPFEDLFDDLIKVEPFYLACGQIMQLDK